MASTFELFHSFKKYLADGTIQLETDTVKLALVTSSYTKDLTDTVWADISTNEVATGNGYTTGGEALSGDGLTLSTTSMKFDATDVTWTALTKTFRFGVLYASVTRNAIVNPLIGIILYDATPADISVSGVDFLTQWATTGIFIVEDV